MRRFAGISVGEKFIMPLPYGWDLDSFTDGESSVYDHLDWNQTIHKKIKPTKYGRGKMRMVANAIMLTGKVRLVIPEDTLVVVVR
jgi:hypothetical protein